MSAAPRHPIFSHFPLAKPSREGALSRNIVGAIERIEYYAGVDMEPYADLRPAPAAPDAAPPAFIEPQLDEEYFEWIDLLRSVADYVAAAPARPYVVAELGAGYGRWSVNAVCALRLLEPQADFRVVAVEADAEHFGWLKAHLAQNGISSARSLLFDAPVAGRARHVRFESGDARRWYGQSILDERLGERLRRELRAVALKHPVLRRLLRRPEDPPTGRYLVNLQAVTLVDVLRDVEVVDLVDMDIQGAEADVVEGSLDVLGQKVIALHIGTHSAAIEARLRAALGGRGWRLERDYACNGMRDTPYGPIGFVDGVQSWRNPEPR